MTTAAELSGLFAEARTRLADAPRERLGAWRTPRKVLGFGADPRIETVGAAWHVGTLLITDDAVAAVGDVVRAQDPGRRGYAAESARERAMVRAAALRGKIPAGDVVHVGWEALDLAAVAAGGTSGPLLLARGTPMIRWSTAGAPMPLANYLRERIDLLLG